MGIVGINRISTNGHTGGRKKATSTNVGDHCLDIGTDFRTTQAEQDLGWNITAQAMVMTPEIAKEWSQKVGKKQRTKKRVNLAQMKSDLLNGRWKMNGEPIIIDSDGYVIDGQHRLAVVIETGVSIPVIVIRGVSPEAYSTLDCGAKRTRSDALASAGYTHAAATGAAALIFARYERGMLRRMDNAGEFSLSNAATEELLGLHAGLHDSVVFTAAAGKHCHSYGATAFCHYILDSIDPVVASTFFEKLATGEDLKRGNPLLALRNRFISERFDGDDTVYLIFKAWNLVRSGKKIEILKFGTTDRLPTPI